MPKARADAVELEVPGAVYGNALTYVGAVVIVVIGLALRAPLLDQDLWYDEIYTLFHFISLPWEQIATTYSPNNHVLFTLAAKACGEWPGLSDALWAIRLPSAIAGALAGVVLAWPLRRRRPYVGLGLAGLMALHPWLLAYGSYARGYAMMLLLAIMATRALPSKREATAVGYGVLLVACIYTQPLAIAVVLGHGVYVVIYRRAVLLTWVGWAAAAGVVLVVLYYPMLRGAGEYWGRAQRPGLTYGRFVVDSLSFSHAGEGAGSPGAAALAGLAGVAAVTVGRRLEALRPAIVTFAVASVFGLLVPRVVPLAGETRAMLWLVPLYCMGVVGVLAVAFDGGGRVLRGVGLAAVVCLVGFLGARVAWLYATPAQPISAAIEIAHQLAQERNTRVVGTYLASAEIRSLYPGIDAVAYPGEPGAMDLPAIEAQLRGGPVVICFYESLLERDQPAAWAHLQSRYRLAARLAGRVSPAGIYVPRGDSAATTRP